MKKETTVKTPMPVKPVHPDKEIEIQLEYITKASTEYLSEEVDKEGKSRQENNYGFTKYSTRGAWLIEKHLKARISELLVSGINEAHAALAKMMEDEVKEALQRTFTTITVATKTQIRE